MRRNLVPALLLLTAPLLRASIRQQNPIPAGPAWLQFVHGKESVPEKVIAVTVEFELKPDDEGVLISGGDYSENYSLEVKAGRLVWTYACVFLKQASITASGKLQNGFVSVRYEFGPEQSTVLGKHRMGKMFVNGQPVNDPATLSDVEQIPEWLACDFTFTGAIRRVSFQKLPAQ